MATSEMPAWLVCDGIISKVRDELLSQAVSLMHEQLDKKRISLEGELPTLKEGESEKERDMFLLSQVAKEYANMEKRFGSYIQEAKKGGETSARVEELQRFLLELRQIVLLKDYSSILEAWLVDAEKELSERDPAMLLAKTMKKDMVSRYEVLDYALKNKKFRTDRLFSDQERKIIAQALSLAKE